MVEFSIGTPSNVENSILDSQLIDSQGLATIDRAYLK
jgi:hypothetical protein